MYSFLKKRKVLVTGHTGFKGTWLVKILEKFEAEIIGFALPDSQTKFYESASVSVKSYWGDVRNAEQLQYVMERERPEIVIHLASHSTVNKGQEITHYIFDTNMMGVVNLFEAIRKTPSVKTVLIVTSDKCYRNLEIDTGYTEDYGFGGQDPYSTSKAVQELLSECYRNLITKNDRRNINIATARASNVIGGGDFNRTRLFPSIINSFMNHEVASIRNPLAIRPWQNVLDVLNGYLLLVQAMHINEENEQYCTAFNFGPEESSFVTVEQVAKYLLEEFPEEKYIVGGENTVVETNILKLNSNKAETLLRWKRKYALKETIHKTAEFEKRFFSGESAKEICESYIDEYYGGVNGTI